MYFLCQLRSCTAFPRSSLKRIGRLLQIIKAVKSMCIYATTYMYNFVMLLSDCSNYYNTQCHALSQLSVGLLYICMGIHSIFWNTNLFSMTLLSHGPVLLAFTQRADAMVSWLREVTSAVKQSISLWATVWRLAADCLLLRIAELPGLSTGAERTRVVRFRLSVPAQRASI